MELVEELLQLQSPPEDYDFEAKREGELHHACCIGDVDLLNKCLVDIDDINKLDSQGRTPLYLAVKKGHTQVVKTLLNHGADPNVTDKRVQYASPLHIALTADTAVQLIEHGACIEARSNNDDTPLHKAVRNFRRDVIKTLVSNEANVNAVNSMLSTPLHVLCASANDMDGFAEEILKLLIEAKADLNLQDFNGKTALHLIASTTVCFNLHLSIISNGGQLDIADNSGNYPLHYLLKNSLTNWEEAEHKDILKLYLSQTNGVSLLNYQGRSVLHFLSSDNNSALIQLAIDEGANIHVKDNFGRTPLHCNLNQADVESIVELMVSNGVDVDVKDEWGRTPLIIAVDDVNQTLTEALIRQKANINLADINGNTALHIACYRDAPGIVELLIINNADVHSKDVNKATALHAAAYAGSLECVEILISAGAQLYFTDSDMKDPFDVANAREHIDVIDVLSDKTTGHTLRKRNLTNVANDFVDKGTALQMIDEGLISREQENVQDFLSDLIESPATGRGTDDEEAREIQVVMENVIQTLAKKLVETDRNLQCTILHAGSTSEGTKTMCPDEFDFMLCLEKLSELVEPNFSSEDIEDLIAYRLPTNSEAPVIVPAESFVSVSDYAQLQIKDAEYASPFHPFLMTYGFDDGFETDVVPCSAMCGAFSELIAKILFSKEFPKHPRLIPIDVTLAPAIEFHWHGPRHKDLKIAVDLVPALRLAEWPEKMRRDCKLFTKTMLQRACLVVPKLTAGKDKYLWRCSLALLETNIIRCLRPKIRNSYIACKCMISSRLLPLIDFGGNDDWTSSYELDDPDVSDEDNDSITDTESVESKIPSYIIKMTFLSVLEDRVAQHGLEYIYDIAALEQEEKNYASVESGATADDCSDSNTAQCTETHDVGLTLCQRLTDAKCFLGCVPGNNGAAETKEANEVADEVSVKAEWYGPALTMNTAVRSTEFDITIVRDVFRECERRLEKSFVPSVFNPNHNVLGKTLFYGNMEKALLYIRMINALLT